MIGNERWHFGGRGTEDSAIVQGCLVVVLSDQEYKIFDTVISDILVLWFEHAAHQPRHDLRTIILLQFHWIFLVVRVFLYYLKVRVLYLL